MALRLTYRRLWELLKTKELLELEAPKAEHERIHKAIRKVAWKDTSHRTQVRDLGGKFYISRAYLGTRLILKLVWTTHCRKIDHE